MAPCPRCCCRYCGLEQALLLAWSTQVKKGTSADELQQWQMTPYVEAVLQQPRSQYMLQVRTGAGLPFWEDLSRCNSMMVECLSPVALCFFLMNAGLPICCPMGGPRHSLSRFG